MRDLVSRAGQAQRFLTPARGDTLIAAVLVGSTLAFVVDAALRGHEHWAVLVVLVLWCAALVPHRRHPLLAAALATIGLATIAPLGQTAFFDGTWTSLAFLPPLFIFSYSLGRRAPLPEAIAGSVLLTGGLWAQNESFVPIFLMMTFGPVFVGRVAASRKRLTDQLTARNAELAAEQEIFARESVRYERARIARELHDIVAHSLSLMVIQASAGQRVRDSGGMTQALTNVAEVAAQAQADIGRLAELLGSDSPTDLAPGLPMVCELVRRATVTGLEVICKMTGPCDDLPALVSATAYRVVQEALTNALKHAPGAPVRVDISACDGNLALLVTNQAAGAGSSLGRSGGGYGLTGMRERALACGGTLTAGPAKSGGWQVSALLPFSCPELS